MRICPRCFQVYGTGFDLYCRSDGCQTIDTASEKGINIVNKLYPKENKTKTNEGAKSDQVLQD